MANTIHEFRSEMEEQFGEDPSTRAPLPPKWRSKVSIDLRWVEAAQPALHEWRRNELGTLVVMAGGAEFTIDFPYLEFMELWLGTRT